MDKKELQSALEIAQSETLEMEALEVMRNPAYGTCFEIAEAFLKTKRSLIALNKENEELKKQAYEDVGKVQVEYNKEHEEHYFTKCKLANLEKEIDDAPWDETKTFKMVKREN